MQLFGFNKVCGNHQYIKTGVNGNNQHVGSLKSTNKSVVQETGVEFYVCNTIAGRETGGKETTGET